MQHCNIGMYRESGELVRDSPPRPPPPHPARENFLDRTLIGMWISQLIATDYFKAPA